MSTETPDDQSTASASSGELHGPGHGWARNGPVYDRADGLRAHPLGYCSLPGGRTISANVWPETQRLRRAVKVNGGNPRRGLLAWARQRAAKAA